MKHIFSFFLLLILAVRVSAQITLPFQKHVKAAPAAFTKPTEQTRLSTQRPGTSAPWIVFSDRDDNYTTTTPGGSLFMKKLHFMEAFFVAEEKGGYVKLIQYNSGMLRGRKINDKKSATSYGWISRWKLLMWNRSYADPATGFALKSIAVINAKMPLEVPQSYYDRTDSAFVYASPELKRVVGKVRLHQITYIYKKSEDGRKYLIGNEDQLVADSADKAISGWIAADAVHNWGGRLYISPSVPGSDAITDSAYALVHQEQIDPLLKEEDFILRSAPVVAQTNPQQYTAGKAVDVYDKSHNTLITIDGSKLQYPDYLDLRKNIHKLNIVFVIDGGSAMKKYYPGLTNIIQSLENTFEEYNKRHELNYGAVVYRDNLNCTAKGIETTNGIYPDYRKLMAFLSDEAEKTSECGSNISSAPVYNGVRAALDLFKTHPHETNLVMLIGSVGDSTEHFQQLSEQFGNLNARLLTIQMYSDYNEWYNNFVLNAKKLVSESAVYSASVKKKFLINGEGLDERLAYNISQEDSVSFFLDYPENSLIQGGVVFPTKGAVNSNRNITNAAKRFLKETDFDIQQQITSLDSAFRLRGIANANLSPAVKAQLEEPVTEDVADRMPHNGFKYYMTSNVPANLVDQHKDLLQYTLVLNGNEYKQMNDILAFMAGQNLAPDQSSFRKKLVANYISIPRNMLDMDISKGTIRAMRLTDYFKTVTGYPLQSAHFERFTVGDLRRESSMPETDFEDYIRFLTRSGENIKTATQVGQQFISNGKIYYYITRENLREEKRK